MNTYNALFFNDKWKNFVKKGLEEIKISLNNQQLELFATHAAHLHMWNRTINLTAIKDPEEIALKHFIDSIALIPYIKNNSKILDIGSGGGFPGFCLKIAKPDLNVIMIDSSKKKVNFLKDLIRTTKITDVEAIHVRAEDLGKQDIYKGTFDIVVSRAFSSLEKFYKLSKPFLNDQGVILAMKGQNPIEEIRQLRELKDIDDFNINLYSYMLPFQDIERSIVKINF